MSDSGNGDKPENKGRFSSESAKAAVKQRGKGKKRMSKLERLAWKAIERALEDKNTPEYVVRQYAELALKYERGTAPTAEQMGTVAPQGGQRGQYGNGVVILPAEERETDGLAATLTRLMADGLAKLTDDELVTLERLQKKMNGDHAPLIRRAVTHGLPLTNYTPDAMAPRSECVAPPASPAIEPQPAPPESPAATENKAEQSPETPSARVFTLVPPHAPERPWPDGNQDESPLDPGAWGRGRP